MPTTIVVTVGGIGPFAVCTFRYLADNKIGHAVVTTPDGELIGLASADDVHRRNPETATP